MLRFPKRQGPRIAPADAPYDAATAAALAALGGDIALFRVFARRPERAQGLHGWGRYYLSRQSALGLRHRELVIGRTTVRCGAEYEWGVHVAVFARKAGLDDGQIRSLVAGGHQDPCWADPGDRAVIRAVDALCAAHDLTDAEWQELAGAVGEEAAVDLLLLCGWYHAVSFAARVLRLPQEPGTPAFSDYLA